MRCGRVGSRLLLQSTLKIHFFRVLFCLYTLRASRKSFLKRFGISAHGESRFPKGLAFPRLAKVISRKVWCFRAWRKSFPKRFGVSAHGESHFPKGLAFPRMAKVVSRIVLCLRASRKSVFKGFDTTRYKAKINQQKNFWEYKKEVSALITTFAVVHFCLTTYRHHINSVKGHPEDAGDPSNIEFVKKGGEHLSRHNGNYRNPSSGKKINRD